MKQRETTKKLKGKILILALGTILLAGQLASQSCQKPKEREGHGKGKVQAQVQGQGKNRGMGGMGQ